MSLPLLGVGHSGVGVGGGDASFSSVNLLLDMQGADNGTTFTDLSSFGHTVTPSGAFTDTAQFKFGTSSAFFDGSNDVLSTSGANEFNLSSLFTHEGWFMFNSTAGDQVLIDVNANPGSSGAFLRFSAGSLDWFNWGASGGNGANGFVNAWSPSTLTWYHIVLCRDGTTTRMFIDGTALGTTNAGAQTFTNSNFGLGGNGAGSRPYSGWIGAYRFTDGVARYTSNFTPPVAPFPTS